MKIKSASIKKQTIATFEIEKEDYHVPDLENASILHVENLDLSKFSWPESYCELFEAGAEWYREHINSNDWQDLIYKQLPITIQDPAVKALFIWMADKGLEIKPKNIIY